MVFNLQMSQSSAWKAYISTQNTTRASNEAGVPVLSQETSPSNDHLAGWSLPPHSLCTTSGAAVIDPSQRNIKVSQNRSCSVFARAFHSCKPWNSSIEASNQSTLSRPALSKLWCEISRILHMGKSCMTENILSDNSWGCYRVAEDWACREKVVSPGHKIKIHSFHGAQLLILAKYLVMWT